MKSNQLAVLVMDIAHLRSKYDITQQEVAKAINVSVGTLSRWESNNFKSTKLIDLINLINFLERRGVKFDYCKGNITCKTDKQTKRNA